MARRDLDARAAFDLDAHQPAVSPLVGLGHAHADRQPSGVLPPNAGLATCAFQQFEPVPEGRIGRAFARRSGELFTTLGREPKIRAQAVENLSFSECAHCKTILCMGLEQISTRSWGFGHLPLIYAH